MPLRRIRLACMMAATLALAAPPGHAQMHKCKDEKGRITYSDQGCAVVPDKNPAPATPQAGAGIKTTSGKLTEVLVTSMIKQASELATLLDYRGQCALAAPCLKFTITLHSTTPPSTLSGGRADLCALQRSSVQGIEAAQLKAAVTLGKQTITVSPDGSKATAVYETRTLLTRQGQTVVEERCSRQDMFGVYGDRILYAGVVASCKPS